MKDDQIVKALAKWKLDDCTCDLIAERENRVYRVKRPNGSLVAMRIHRKNLRSSAEIRSELQMMRAVHAKGQIVPAPLPTETGDLLAIVGGEQIDVLTWVNGRSFLDLPSQSRVEFFKQLGEVAADFHNNIDAWTPPSNFSRPSWDRQGLIGNNPLWGVFWDNPSLSPSDKEIILRARANIETRLQTMEENLDYGLIHADMVRENILFEGNNIGLIDFDDSGFGFRLFEIATILQAQLEEPDYVQVKASLIEGYSSKRTVSLDSIDMFIVLRTWTYLGWIISRIDEPGSKARNEKYVARSVRRSRQWLQGLAIS